MQVRDDSGVEHDSNHEAEWLQVSVDVLKVELTSRIWVYDRKKSRKPRFLVWAASSIELPPRWLEKTGYRTFWRKDQELGLDMLSLRRSSDIWMELSSWIEESGVQEQDLEIEIWEH